HRDDQVALVEVVRAADDSARFALTDVDLTPAHRLAVLVLLGLERQHAPEQQRTAHTRLHDLLELEVEIGQPVGECLRREVGGQVDVLAQPRDGNTHQTSIPKGRGKRTSPSNMSRMSARSCRNISVRSMPMPNAKPLYRSESTPHAVSTRGL